ncbi:MAG: tetratricopeptide repeat protein, partial [Hyphomicrobiales bacterium]
TLQAVHETLEHIVGKIAELESGNGFDDDEADADEAEAEDIARDYAEEPAAETTDNLAQDETSSFDAEPESAVDDSETDETATDTGADGFVFPESPADEETDSGSDDAPQEQVHEPESAYAPAEPAEPPVREDYIAAARRAAQMAATRSQNPVTSGFNKFSQRFSGSSEKKDEPEAGSAPRRGFVASLFGGLRGRKAKSGHDAKPGDDANSGSKASKRKRLIFAGLVLLAAASAYGAQRQDISVPAFDLLGGGFIDPKAEEVGSAPAADTARRPHDALATASIAPLGRADSERSAAVDVTLPAEIGPHSLRLAALGGDAIAQYVVAGRYLEGEAVTRDEDKAAQWYERAARQGLAAAQYRLGSMYEHGRGMPLDPREAVAWYEQAAEGGNINAMHNLAVLHTGARSVRRNYDVAANWFQKAAERGLRDSQFNLAVLHEQGLGVPRSPEDAVFWYSLAAVQGDDEARAKAKELEASLTPETAKQVHARLLEWQALPADRNANVVPVADPSWQGMS